MLIIRFSRYLVGLVTLYISQGYPNKKESRTFRDPGSHRSFLMPIIGALIAAGGALPLGAVAEERSLALEEIIVTAQKREESLQQTPLAISALSGDQLENLGITGLGDMMAGALPSLRIQPFPNNPGTLIISMRGVGPADAGQITKDPGVGIYLDGVYLGRAQGLGLDVIDVDRIEVLRGPQGTLYGRNVAGGAVNLISKRPLGEFGFKQTLSYGDEFGESKSVTHLETASFGGLAARFSFVTHEHDGYVENAGDGSAFSDYNAYDKQGGRLALSWEASDTFTADYTYDKSSSEFVQNYYQLHDIGNLMAYDPAVLPPPDLRLLATPRTPEAQQLFQNIGAGAYLGALRPFPNDEPSNSQVSESRAALYLAPNEVDVEGHSLILDWDISDSVTLKSITSSRELEQETHTNYGGVFGVGLASIAPFGQIEQEQLSQEFQLIGSAGSIEYVLGAYYYSEEASEATALTATALRLAFVPLSMNPRDPNFQASITPFPLIIGGAVQGLDEPVGLIPGTMHPMRIASTETDSWAVFGQVRWQATDKLGITLGLRYTEDQKDSERPRQNAMPQDPIPVSKIDDSSTDPMVTLDYDWNDSLNTYIRFATAYKAGGVNLRSNEFPSYKKETVDAWEIGFKSTFWDSRARVNIAAWMSDYEDMQIDFSDPIDVTISETFNASNGNVELSGIEIEVSVRLTEGLLLSLDYNYSDWSLKPQPNPLDDDMLADFEIAQMPRHAGSLNLDYQFKPSSFGTLSVHLNYYGQSSAGMRYSPLGNLRRDGRDLVNGRISLSDIAVGENGGAFRISLWGKNLLDEEFVLYSITHSASSSVSDAWGEPRSVGVALVYEY